MNIDEIIGHIIKNIKALNNIPYAQFTVDEIKALYAFRTAVAQRKKTTLKEQIEGIKNKISNDAVFITLYNKINRKLTPCVEKKKTELSVQKNFQQNFDQLNKEEKQHRVNLLAEGLANTKEQEVDLNRSLNALLNLDELKQIGVYKTEFFSSTQLPFSNHLLFLKITQEYDIWFKIGETAEWRLWEGTKHCKMILKSDGFRITNQWQRDEELKLVDTFISIAYRAAVFYFQNVRGN